jgi:hypothetical protein
MACPTRSLFLVIAGLRKVTVLVLLVALTPFLANCYGKFPLTHAVYKANGDIDNGLLRQIVFWVFVIVPVYGISMLADAVVFNLLDFWFGETIHLSSATDAQGNTVTLQPSEDGREAVLTVSRDGRTLQELRFVRTSDAVCDVYDADGALAGRAERTAAGELRLTDAQGRTVLLAGPQELAQAMARRGLAEAR